MQRAQPREPLVPPGTPSRAWQIVGSDLFVIKRETYLLVSEVSIGSYDPKPSDKYRCEEPAGHP